MAKAMDIINLVFWNNTVLDYIIFLGVLLLGAVLIFVLGRVALRRIAANSKRTQSPYARLTLSGFKQYLLPIAYFSLFYFCTRLLTLNDQLSKLVGTLSILFAIVMGAMFLSSLAALFFGKLSKSKGDSGSLAVKWLIHLAKGAIWGVALILLLDNAGVKITSLVTGLGVGGIAIAFAAQSALSDIFCFFTIFFDKPFEIGDFIIAGEHMGTVEHIGVKSTRLRAIGGEQLIVSNADLTGSRVRNYKTMQQRRVNFILGVTYDTPSEKLEAIPQMIRKIVEETEDATFSRTHFAAFGAYSLHFEVVYFVQSADYDRYMEINERINLAIKDGFERLGVQFAFPTSTVQVQPSFASFSPEK
ncbi:MAG: mechanosensitive ion channel family protein [Eubacteriales bacterium]|jgi:small-conductance mechanosensitive channel|nr:mechanosensitive ion channel family protein [Eubacteriales bacterium]